MESVKVPPGTLNVKMEVRRATATERRARSVIIIAAFSALCRAVLIGLAVLIGSNV